MTSKKWTPATSQRRPDNILSNKFISIPQFIPSYERKPVKRSSMYFLLSNEYARIWQDEHMAYDHVQYPRRPPKSGTNGKIQFSEILRKKHMLQGNRVKRISFRSPVPADSL